MSASQFHAFPLQATKGAFSAYAYEVLPLLHTLLGQNKLKTDTFSVDTLAFLSGYKGHITAVMRDVAANAKRGLKGSAAASVKGHADSLVKVYAHVSLSPVLCASLVHPQCDIAGYNAMILWQLESAGTPSWNIVVMNHLRAESRFPLSRSFTTPWLRRCLSLWPGMEGRQR